MNKNTNSQNLDVTPAIAKQVLEFVLIKENETVVKTNRECELCGCKVDKYDKFTKEEHCQNCGWL